MPLHRKIEDEEIEFWCKELPYLNFPEHWLVKAIPPFNSAIVRYLITTRKLLDNKAGKVSIYFDGTNEQRFEKRAFWEIYGTEVERFLYGDEVKMLDAINKQLLELEAEV